MGESLDVPADVHLDGYGSYLEAAVRGGLVPARWPCGCSAATTR